MGVIRGTARRQEGYVYAGKALTQILDRRAHLRHADYVGDGRLGRDDAAQLASASRHRDTLCKRSPSQGIRIFLTKLLEKHYTELC